MKFIENCRSNWRNYVLQGSCSETHSRFFVTSQMDEDLCGGRTSSGMRPYQATGPMTWKTYNDELICISDNMIIIYRLLIHHFYALPSQATHYYLFIQLML